MTIEQVNESTALFFKDGSSDKVYQAQLEECLGGWVVNFQYGRRGSALTAGTKTKDPVDYKTAKKAYDKIVAEKTGKGYSLDVEGKTFQSLLNGKVHSGLSAQLSNEISDEEAEALIEDPAWIAQEKFDGRRRMLRKTGLAVEGTNREGILVALASEIETGVKNINVENAVFDGEDLGGCVMLFDILECNGEDYRELGVLARLEKLTEILGKKSGFFSEGKVGVAHTAITTDEKRALVEQVRAGKREGIVFKKIEAPYTPGRPASKGNHRKWKFYEQATCRVKSHHKTKASVEFELMDSSGNWNSRGNVKIPTNHVRPPIGALIEVKYLYAYLGGSLYQTSYRGQRDDVSESACVDSQLKYKASVSDDEDGDADA